MNFEEALNDFKAAINKSIAEKCPNYYKEIEECGGRKYLRLAVVRECGGASAYCFVNRENGEIYKPASWKTPAKDARGSIYDPDSYKGCDPWGSWLYK